jgi:hypothetical protein
MLLIVAIWFMAVWGNQGPAASLAHFGSLNFHSNGSDNHPFLFGQVDNEQDQQGEEPPESTPPGESAPTESAPTESAPTESAPDDGSAPAETAPAEEPTEILEPGTVLTPTASLGTNFIYIPVAIYEIGGEESGNLEINPEAIYYVATNGNDSSGNGSSSRPWRSINTAIRRVPDGSKIMVRPGTYNGKVVMERIFSTGIIIQSERPYQAKLRNSSDKVVSGYGRGYTLTGFDIAHNPGASGTYIIQLWKSSGNGSSGQRITIKDNVIHDSYHDDLLKVNAGARDIVIQGNIFYNMGGPNVDEHIDVNSAYNVTIQDNIFFNRFEDSGRTNHNSTGSFIVIKDSNGANDGVSGSHGIDVRRNIFLNWQGEVGSAFIGLGDGNNYPFYQAWDILIENNLFLGNSNNKVHGPIKAMGVKDLTFRNNTISGDMPSNSFSMRLMKSSSGLKNVNVRFFNNIWADPAGTMGADTPTGTQRFSNTPPSDTDSFSINSNLYWNSSRPIPVNPNDLINYTRDSRAITANPRLNTNHGGIIPPCWDAGRLLFDGGSPTIREAFKNLIWQFGYIPSDSPARDSGNDANAPADDILGNPRNVGAKDIGAFEWRP